jgi:hypothetical protein
MNRALITGREPHPTVWLPPDDYLAMMSDSWKENVWQVRREQMVRMAADPLNYGYEPPSWKRADDALVEFRKKYPVGVLIHLSLGGHRAGKTEWRSKRTVQNMFKNPDYKVWACQSTQESSREAQQGKIYNYLPPAYRNESGKLRQGAKLKVNYTPWGGFTEDVFAVQNIHRTTSECRFKFYSMNPRSLEGAEINEGWLDEEAPLEWLDALIFRLVSRNGILYFTFTPRWGYTQTVKAVLNGAVTLEETDADTDLLAVRDAKGEVIATRKLPLRQENLNVTVPGHKARATIVYFHTSENPFPYVVNPENNTLQTNWDQMKATLMGAREDKILTTAYGVPTRAMMARFPMFNDLVHIVSLNRFREIQKEGGTWFHFLDPCSGRNWFQIWIFCDRLNRAFVAGESPSFDHEWAYIPGIGNPGPWAIPATGNSTRYDGDMGDGQKEWGWGYVRYQEEIDRMERLLSGQLNTVGINGSSALCAPLSDVMRDSRPDAPTQNNLSGSGGVSCVPTPTTPPPAQSKKPCAEEQVAHKIRVNTRWIDARYGNARKTAEERSTTLIEDLWAMDLEFLAAPSEKAIDSGRGGGDGSLRMINDKFFYDVTRAIDHTNQPKLYVVETCPNTIYAIKEWTGKDGQHGACKDPIDCLRMFVLTGSEHVDEALLQPIQPWMEQFRR